MRRIDIVSRAARNLRQAKGRTFLTALAIAVGAFTIMMSLAAGAGTREYTQNMIQSNVDPQTLVVFKDEKLKQGNGGVGAPALQEYSENKDPRSGLELISQDDIDAMKKRSDVDWVEPFFQMKIKYAQFEGIDKKYSINVSKYDSSIKTNVSAGQLPAKGKRIGETDIVIPESYTKVLGKNSSELIGKKVTLTVVSTPQGVSDEELSRLYMTGVMAAVEARMQGEEKQMTFTVRAVTSQNSSTMMADGGQASIDAKAAYEISEYTTKGTSDYHKYYTVTVRAKDGVLPSELKTRLEKENKLYSMTAEDMQQMIFQFVNVLQYIVFGFGVLALVASVFGIINTQYISVLERTSQIGLMKALGMPNGGIGKLFRYEAAWIGFLGGLIGILLAWVAIFFLNPWITSTLNLGEGNYLLKFEWLSSGLLVIGLILVAIVAGWFPSRKAAKLDPIEALRTE